MKTVQSYMGIKFKYKEVEVFKAQPLYFHYIRPKETQLII